MSRHISSLPVWLWMLGNTTWSQERWKVGTASCEGKTAGVHGSLRLQDLDSRIPNHHRVERCMVWGGQQSPYCGKGGIRAKWNWRGCHDAKKWQWHYINQTCWQRNFLDQTHWQWCSNAEGWSCQFHLFLPSLPTHICLSIACTTNCLNSMTVDQPREPKHWCSGMAGSGLDWELLQSWYWTRSTYRNSPCSCYSKSMVFCCCNRWFLYPEVI